MRAFSGIFALLPGCELDFSICHVMLPEPDSFIGTTQQEGEKMSIVSKLSFGILAAVSVGMMSAQEVVNLSKPEDFFPSKKIVKAEDALSIKGVRSMFSAKSFSLDPAKKYQLSGEFCQKAGKPVTVFFGFAPFDAKNRPVTAAMVNVVKDTLTEVAADAKKGDKVIKVKDASKWNTKGKYSSIAFNAKKDFSDLPNADQLSTAVPNAKKNGEVWEILLRKPLAKNIAAGTLVRQHSDGSSYIYAAGVAKLSDKWITRKGVISGIAPVGNVSNKMWKGTAKVRVVVLMLSGDADSDVSFRNIKVTEVK